MSNWCSCGSSSRRILPAAAGNCPGSLCEALDWKQSNGVLRDVVCRGLLLMLERAGQIELPPVRRRIRGQCPSDRRRPEAMRVDTTQLSLSLSELGLVEIQPVRRTAEEPLFNSLMEHYHYLGYEQPVGEHLKYLAWAQSRPIACLAWSSAPRHLGSRDRYIGWSATARRRNIRFIAYNTRFCFCPGCACRTWLPTFWGRRPARFPMIGNGCTAIPFTSRKPSLIPGVFGAPATGRPTGDCWG